MLNVILEYHVTGPHALTHQVSAFIYIYIYIYIYWWFEDYEIYFMFLGTTVGAFNDFSYMGWMPLWGVSFNYSIYYFISLTLGCLGGLHFNRGLLSLLLLLSYLYFIFSKLLSYLYFIITAKLMFGSSFTNTRDLCILF